MTAETTTLATLAARILERDAAFAATHAAHDFLIGYDLTLMSPDEVEAALSAYVIGDTALRSPGDMLFEPLHRTNADLRVFNTYRFTVSVAKSDYLTNFIYVPLILASRPRPWSPQSARCCDGKLSVVYETSCYGDGERTPEREEIADLQMDPGRRIELAEAALDANRKLLRSRDDLFRKVGRSYRKRWNRAVDARRLAAEIAASGVLQRNESATA